MKVHCLHIYCFIDDNPLGYGVPEPILFSSEQDARHFIETAGWKTGSKYLSRENWFGPSGYWVLDTYEVN